MAGLSVIRALVTCLPALLLAGCASGVQVATAPSTTDVEGVTGAEIHQPVSVRPQRANEYIQNGRVLPYDGITDYYPYCELSLNAIQPDGIDIRPGAFTVTRVHRDTTMASRPVRVAGGDWGFIMSTTTFFLSSDEQPQVRALVCERLDESFRAKHLTLEEIRNTLGGLVSLQTGDRY